MAEIMNIDINKIIWDTTKSDGCMKKTVSNDILKKLLPDYKFKNIDDALNETYTWFVNNFDNCRK